MKPFKTIEIGGQPHNALIQQLMQTNVKFNKYAEILFEHPAFRNPVNRESVQLVKLTLSELELTQSSPFRMIVSHAERRNLSLCPLILGAYLRLEYLDQPESGYLTIASAKPENDEAFPNGFYLRNFGGSLWLRGYRASEDYLWPVDSEFVFIK